MNTTWRGCPLVKVITQWAWVLIILVALSISCTAAQWSRFLHSKALIDDGRLLLPTIFDIITDDQGIYAHDRPFGQVILTAPQRLFDDQDEDPSDETITAAVLDYFRQYAGGYAIEFVEDYSRRVDETVSMCFSQAVNGVRIYGTAACAEIHQNKLRSAWHLFVVPPSICTEPEVPSERALGVTMEQVKALPAAQVVIPELNITFVDRVPMLVWRVPVPMDNGTRTYFVDAKSGQLAAITTAAYRQTDGAKVQQEQTASLD